MISMLADSLDYDLHVELSRQVVIWYLQHKRLNPALLSFLLWLVNDNKRPGH